MKSYKLLLLALAGLAGVFTSCSDLDLNESQYHTKK